MADVLSWTDTSTSKRVWRPTIKRTLKDYLPARIRVFAPSVPELPHGLQGKHIISSTGSNITWLIRNETTGTAQRRFKPNSGEYGVRDYFIPWQGACSTVMNHRQDANCQRDKRGSSKAPTKQRRLSLTNMLMSASPTTTSGKAKTVHPSTPQQGITCWCR